MGMNMLLFVGIGAAVVIALVVVLVTAGKKKR